MLISISVLLFLLPCSMLYRVECTVCMSVKLRTKISNDTNEVAIAFIHEDRK